MQEVRDMEVGNLSKCSPEEPILGLPCTDRYWPAGTGPRRCPGRITPSGSVETHLARCVHFFHTG